MYTYIFVAEFMSLTIEGSAYVKRDLTLELNQREAYLIIIAFQYF